MPKKIPKKFYPYFWDVDPAKINLLKDSSFVIQRLLDKGDLKTVSWIKRNFRRGKIVKTFEQVRDFSPRIANFWRLFFKIPLKKIICLQEPYLSTRKSHWPF